MIVYLVESSIEECGHFQHLESRVFKTQAQAKRWARKEFEDYGYPVHCSRDDSSEVRFVFYTDDHISGLHIEVQQVDLDAPEPVSVDDKQVTLDDYETDDKIVW